MKGSVPRSYAFRREREATWRELEGLLGKAERHGLRSLDQGSLSRLPVLYRATVSALSVARAISLDRNLVSYLEGLASRAYFYVYGTRRPGIETAGDFVWRRFPQVVRRFKWQVAVSALVMLLGVATGLVQTLQDPERYYAFVDADLAQGRDPSASTEDLREVLYHHESMAETLTALASFLFSHNSRIGMLCFALGFAMGVPVLYLLFTNGLMLGAMGALYQSRGLALDFWGWVLPHGLTELFAVVLCGAGGLVLAQSLLQPGRYKRLQNLARHGREAGTLVLGAVLLFFVAANLEGFFRQLVGSVPVRYAVIAATALVWVLYFGWMGREARR